jgi:hypothetical protein
MPRRMASGVAVGVALAVFGCADPEIEPRSPVHDSFPEQLARIEQSAPPPPPREVHSVSLGFIGDNRIGIEPNPPHRVPYWQQPFPCDWTNTCWMAPPRIYYAPYVGAYAVPAAAP